MKRRSAGVAAVAIAAIMLIGAADDPADRLKNPAQEARARALFQQLRCVVCQNESIDDSEADLAQDLRRIVRGQIAEGRSDDQVRAFLVQRYGQFILLKPPLSPGNATLWLTPVVLVLAGGAYVWRRARAARADEPPLTAAEERALSRLQAQDRREDAPGSQV
jgi:cytochrome c-type biogenesis protein CcmH